VVEVVVDHQACLRIEVGVMRGQQLEVVGGGQGAVLDLGAAGEGRGAHGVLIGMDQGTQPLGGGFAAGGAELVVVEGAAGAVADALGGEDLDQVGALLLVAPNRVPDLVGGPFGVGDGPNGGEDAGSGLGAGFDGLAQGQVAGRAHALHGGEAGEQGGAGVLGDFLVGGGAVLALAVLAVGPEVVGDVDVGVNPARHHHQAGEVERLGPGGRSQLGADG